MCVHVCAQTTLASLRLSHSAQSWLQCRCLIYWLKMINRIVCRSTETNLSVLEVSENDGIVQFLPSTALIYWVWGVLFCCNRKGILFILSFSKPYHSTMVDINGAENSHDEMELNFAQNTFCSVVRGYRWVHILWELYVFFSCSGSWWFTAPLVTRVYLPQPIYCLVIVFDSTGTKHAAFTECMPFTCSCHSWCASATHSFFHT